MANIRTLQKSFGGGEVTPEFFGRIDDAKYQSGAALMRNFIALPHGPAANRPGFAFVRAVKDSTKKTRLIPFSYSTTQTFAIEIGAGYFRFHSNGATLMNGLVPYEISNPYAEADLFDIHYVQSADVLTLVHPNYAPQELRRLGALSWTLTTISFVSTLTTPTSVSAVATLAASPTSLITYNYQVTSVGSDGLDESLASSAASGPAIGITGITKAIPGVITTLTAHNLVVGQPVTIVGVLGMTQINTASLGPVLVNSTPTTTTLTLKTASTGAPVDTSTFGTYTSGGTITGTGVVNNLLQTGASNKISWPTVAGAYRYNVYKQSNGLYGYIGQTDGLNFTDDNITADISKTPPQFSNPFASAGNYPAAVSYYEQRRCFAGTTNNPQTLWMTRTGTESNMSYSLPTRDDDALNFRVAAREANTIRHIVPLSNLVLLTSSAEWRVTSVNSDAITPSTVSVRPQSYVGANNVQPVIVNNNLIYPAARGGHIRELGYSWQSNGYVTNDLSLRAPHLFDGLDIVDAAYAKGPQPICWFVSTSGKLLGFTYVPEQQVGAWHQHDTSGGTFESICVVAEGGEDALYAVIRRTINGSSVRYVERLGSRLFATQADAFFVDCGATYSGAAATTISGLSHLEGKTVSILADGAVHPQRVVTGGSITLDVSATKVQVGLPIQADLQTLPMAVAIDAAFGQGRYKNVNRAWVRVYKSSGIFVGPNANELVEAKQRTTEVYGSPPSLKSEEIPILLTPTWADNGQIFIRQADPLPLTIVSLTLEVALGA